MKREFKTKGRVGTRVILQETNCRYQDLQASQGKQGKVPSENEEVREVEKG
jgi:hypothetical protein